MVEGYRSYKDRGILSPPFGLLGLKGLGQKCSHKGLWYFVPIAQLDRASAF